MMTPSTKKKSSMRLEQAKMVPSRIRISGLLLLAQRVEGFHQSGLRVARLDRGSQWTLRRRAEPSSLVSGSSSSINQGREDAVYEQPELYDLAFSYRDFDAEVDFLLAAHQRHARPPHAASDSAAAAPLHVLELAAGPARHCLAALQAGVVDSATALDSSTAMVNYGRNLAASQSLLASAEGQATPKGLRYLHGNMADFALPSWNDKKGDKDGAGNNDGRLVDSAWCLLGSAGHLLTNEEMEGMLRSCAQVIRPGGTLILELPHPRETFRLEDVTTDGWDVPEGDDNVLGIGLKGDQGGILGVVWGNDDDEFDPLTQIRQATVSLELEREGVIKQRVEATVPQREYTLQEIVALATLSSGYGGGEVLERREDDEDRPPSGQKASKGPGVKSSCPVATYGALEVQPDGTLIDASDEEEAFRLIVVLTRSSD